MRPSDRRKMRRLDRLLTRPMSNAPSVYRVWYVKRGCLVAVVVGAVCVIITTFSR